MWTKLAYLAMAGGCGTVVRYGVTQWVDRYTGGGYPWGTLVVNAVGCLLFGLVWMSAEQRGWVSPQVRLIILTGFMGALTTFSTFGFETVQMVQTRQWAWAVGHVTIQNTLGLAMVLVGLTLGRWV